MPLAVESLTENSNIEEIREAISQSIEKCVNEGTDQKQCAAMSYDIAREKTGKELNFGK